MVKYVVYEGPNKEDLEYLGMVEADTHHVARNKAQRKYEIKHEFGDEGVMVIIPKSVVHVYGA